jgi:hypothetical protein
MSAPARFDRERQAQFLVSPRRVNRPDRKTSVEHVERLLGLELRRNRQTARADNAGLNRPPNFGIRRLAVHRNTVSVPLTVVLERGIFAERTGGIPIGLMTVTSQSLRAASASRERATKVPKRGSAHLIERRYRQQASQRK